jgi:hypothetical protein
MPKSVGILTFHHTTNYGATLQTWALQKRLRELGVASEIIDYRPAKARAAYGLVLNRRFLQGARKAFAFACFRQRHLQLSPQVITELDDLPAVVAQYDTVICGSDEVWNTSSFRGYDPGFFLPFTTTMHVHKCSYAASAGSTASFGCNKSVIADAIRTFAAVSVRDEGTRELLLQECDIDAVMVVDPTLLVNFDELIADDQRQLSPYVLIYGSLSVAEQHMVSTKAAQMGCRIVAIGEFHHCADENLAHAGVESWLRLMRAAEMVFTSFFHGAIFAWKFGRPLVVFERVDKQRKVKGFVNDMALLSSPFLCSAESDSAVNAIEYSSSESTAARLAAAQKRAQQFLLSCLE